MDTKAQFQKSILITGATGFVGKHLVDNLSAKGYKLILSNLRNDNWTHDFENNSFQTVIHLAGIAHELKGKSSHNIYEKINVTLAVDVFKTFIKSNATQFIYFSSIKALADQSDNPLQEFDYQNIDNDYGLSKRKAEQALLSLLPNDSAKSLYILRPAMIYGSVAKGNFALLQKLVNKKIPYPFSKIENRRNLLYINNLNYIIGQFVDSAAPTGIYNICDDDAVSVPQLLRWMRFYSNKPTLNLNVPKVIINIFIKLSKSFDNVYNKLTNNFLIDNTKMKDALNIKHLPYSTEQAIEEIYKNKDLK